MIRDTMPQVKHAVNADALESWEEAATNITLVLPGRQVRCPGVLEDIRRREETFSTVVAVVQGLQRRHNFVLTEL